MTTIYGILAPEASTFQKTYIYRSDYTFGTAQTQLF